MSTITVKLIDKNPLYYRSSDGCIFRCLDVVHEDDQGNCIGTRAVYSKFDKESGRWVPNNHELVSKSYDFITVAKNKKFKLISEKRAMKDLAAYLL